MREIQVAPGTHRTIKDLAYSRSPECPFIVNKISMADLRGSLRRYEDANSLLSPDAQVGLRKSIAAALGERRGSQQWESYAAAYPYSVDAENLVEGLCGPRLLESLPDDGSGTMSMDLGTECDTPSIPPAMPLPESVGSEVCVNRK